MSAFNPGDTLTINAKSYERPRRFTVVKANGHRTVLRGSKGAHRVLVKSTTHTPLDDHDVWSAYSIHEDDGEKNRGRPCTVDEVEAAAVGPLASVSFGGESDARTSPADPFTFGQSLTEMITAPPEVERLLARNRRTTGDTPTPTREDQIRRECEAIADMLIAKNRDYGDSALDPMRIFSKADPTAGLRVRIDDKLSRLARGNDAGEDTVKDLLGYLVLLRIAETT